ncbi:MAG: hypothetical protein V4581_01295 [Bacteroidota bacterium]
MQKSLLFFIALLSQVAFAQNTLEGNYAINNLITDHEVNEYILYPRPDAPYIYGNSVTFRTNGTFTSGYAAECGNDCFTHAAGTYTMPDESHIRFVVDTVTVTGDCKHQNYGPHKDLGLYLLLKSDKDIRLLKSSGDAKADALTRSYSEAIDAFDRETANIPNFHPIPARPGGTNTTDDGKVAAALHGNPAFDMAEVKVLYSKILRSYFQAILFEHKGKQHIVLCIIHSGYVGLYDPAKWPKK